MVSFISIHSRILLSYLFGLASKQPKDHLSVPVQSFFLPHELDQRKSGSNIYQFQHFDNKLIGSQKLLLLTLHVYNLVSLK